LKKAIFIYLGILLSLICNVSIADEDSDLIAHVIRQQWQTPDAKLEIAPIVVEGNHAIAGWAHGARGGRALLRRSANGWQVYMCGGDDLTKVHVLEQSGIESVAAKSLADKLITAEQGMGVDARKQLSIFEGVVPVETNHHHAH